MDADPRDLRSLISTLQQLEASGTREISGDCWYKDGEGRSLLVDDIKLATAPDVPKIIDNICRMRATATLLQSLFNSVTSELERFTTKTGIAIRHYGISTLPDEILQLVLELVFDSSSRDSSLLRDYFNLTSVCRRFRAALISNPQLRVWRLIENHHGSAWRELQLARSKNCPLTVYSRNPVADYETQKEFWTSLEGHCKRWQTVEIHSTSAPDVVEEPKFTVPSDLDLPMLSKLTIYDFFTHATPNNSSIHPCRSWRMPNLQQLYADSTLFALMLPTSLQTLYASVYPTDVSAVSEMLAVLRSDVGKGLTELTLRFNSDADSTGVMSLPSDRRIITMPQLLKCVLDLDNSRERSLSILHNFAPCLHMPNVDLISVGFECALDRSTISALGGWLSSQRFVRLKSLVVSVFASEVLYDHDHRFLKANIRAELEEWLGRTWEEEDRRPELRLVYYPDSEDECEENRFDEIWESGPEDDGDFDEDWDDE